LIETPNLVSDKMGSGEGLHEAISNIKAKKKEESKKR